PGRAADRSRDLAVEARPELVRPAHDPRRPAPGNNDRRGQSNALAARALRYPRDPRLPRHRSDDPARVATDRPAARAVRDPGSRVQRTLLVGRRTAQLVPLRLAGPGVADGAALSRIRERPRLELRRA